MRRFLVGLLLLSLAAPGMAQLFQKADDLLEPEKAFRISARALDEKTAEVKFIIADGYYMYRDKFRFAAEGNPEVRLGAPQLPAGTRHKDEFFGETETYRKQVTIRIPAAGEGRFEIKVVSQGCADVGVCYVPMESQATLTLVAAAGQGPIFSEGPRQIEAEERWSIFASDIDIAAASAFITAASFAVTEKPAPLRMLKVALLAFASMVL